MELGSIFHRTSDNFSYSLNDDDLVINIMTGYDVKTVTLVYGDPFEGGILGGNWQWTGHKSNMPYKKDLENHIWWTTTIKPEFKRCKYYFEIIFLNNEVIYYLEDGFCDKETFNNSLIMKQMFTNPWMNPIDVNTTPNWVNDTCWYQIFPDRFNNKNNKNNGIKKWQTGKVTNEEIYGGNIEGIIDRLDYIQDLGINGIYLTPIFEANSIHKYDTIDYYKCDSLFGDNESLKLMVEEAHKKDIKVMFDGVFNHTGTGFFAWQDILENGYDSKYIGWYMVNSYPFTELHSSKSNEYYAFAFVDDMPKLNTNNQEVIDYLIDVCIFWVKEFNIDGLRLDVANEVSHNFCKQLRLALKKIKPDIYILGEIWHDAINWLRNDEYDAVMNYPLTSAINNFWADTNKNKVYLRNHINKCYTMYMQQTNDVLFNLLDSHDTQRLFTRVNKNKDSFYQQLLFLYSMPGSPSLYYGTELCLEGDYDPDCRRCMPWNEIINGKYDEEIAMMKNIIELRKRFPSLKSRNFHFENNFDNKRVIELLKICENNVRIMLIFNASEECVNIEETNFIFTHNYKNHVIKPGGIAVYYV